MAKSIKPPPLTIVGSSIQSWAEPPPSLGQHGRKLWASVMDQYKIDDVGGRALLEQGCAALDRAESLRAAIDRDGEIIASKHGPKEHPGLRSELANRAFLVRTIQKLGLNYEVVRPVGRPPSPLGWIPPR